MVWHACALFLLCLVSISGTQDVSTPTLLTSNSLTVDHSEDEVLLIAETTFQFPGISLVEIPCVTNEGSTACFQGQANFSLSQLGDLNFLVEDLRLVVFEDDLDERRISYCTAGSEGEALQVSRLVVLRTCHRDVLFGKDTARFPQTRVCEVDVSNLIFSLDFLCSLDKIATGAKFSLS